MENKKSNGNIATILAMMFLYAMISFVTNLAAPAGKIWAANPELGGSPIIGMMGNFMNFAAYLLMGIPAGALLTKVGYKKTALIAVVLGFVGVFVQWCSGFPGSAMMGFVVYLTGAFIAGFCVCMLNTVVNPLLNLLGGGGNRGNQLNMTGGTINSLSGSLTPMLVGALIGQNLQGKTIADVNLVMFIAMAVFALVFVVIAITPVAEPNQDIKIDENDKHSAWSFRHFVLGAVSIFFYVGIEIGIPATLINYLNPIVGFATAGFIAGLYWLLMLVGRFTGSAIGGKVSSKQMVSVVASVGIALMVLAMLIGKSIEVPFLADWTFKTVQVPLAAVLLVCCGLCTSVMWGCIFNMAVEGLGKYTAKASGIFMMMVVGGGIVPMIQSGVESLTSPLVSYIVPVLGMAFILFYALVGSKNVNTDIKVD